MDDQLHPAGLVEEPLEDDVALARHHSELFEPCRKVGDDLFCRIALEPASRHHVARCGFGTGLGQLLGNGHPQVRDLLGELGRAARCLPDPKRDGRPGTFGVCYPNFAGGDPADAPRVSPEEEDVAGHRFDCKVLVDGADQDVVGLGNDSVIADLGDGPPARQRGQARSPARPQDAVDAVAVEVSHARPTARRDPLRGQLDNGVEVIPGQLPVRGGPAEKLEEPLFPPLAGSRDLGDDLLGQDVQWRTGGQHCVEAALADCSEQRRALDKFVPRGREKYALGHPMTGVVGAPDPLQEGRDRPR